MILLVFPTLPTTPFNRIEKLVETSPEPTSIVYTQILTKRDRPQIFNAARRYVIPKQSVYQLTVGPITLYQVMLITHLSVASHTCIP